MDRLRRRDRKSFTGFTNTEIKKMEKMLEVSRETVLDKEFCQYVAKAFNRSSGRAGKPVVKWTEVHSWFHNAKQESAKASKNVLELAGASLPVKSSAKPAAEEKNQDLSELEFEARSAKDGAWYDVDMFLAHRVLSTGETEVRVRFVGYGAEEDEWINIKKAVRERSVPLEHSECHKVKEKGDQASHYDAQVLEIQRRMHDIRGCRCIFLVRYNHDESEERVRLKRLCGRPTYN
ncbi:protein SAWADEE HOMEODOMAIN HOMOLOG 1-like isoform X3 [Humulus lupulus]|uniref:protein SAWADEE HOMEODOMAIN HOMOLOG 1-like isoform X3 n=1 Tax=Humulus lupulus TaxID=3486 RepID=UPI002B415673|nr:protein SAWADEE HOMEODOMAIN HOMOLOG 1-like isoform X3 [Humulus lupulus]